MDQKAPPQDLISFRQLRTADEETLDQPLVVFKRDDNGFMVEIGMWVPMWLVDR